MKTAKFKDSPLGPIPQDWEVKRLGDEARINRGGSPRPIESWLTTSVDGINWIKIGDVAEGAKYICSTAERIMPEAVQFSRSVKSGDFLLSNSMSFGRPYILKISGCIHDGWLTIQDYKDTFDCEYLYYILGSEAVFQQYVALADGSSVKNLNKDKVEKVLVPCPPLPEQQRIAEALGEVDKLIESLDEQVEKKRLIAKGVAHDLLSGKKRLPGFKGAWREVAFKAAFISLGNNTYARECLCGYSTNAYDIHYGDVLIRFGAVVDFSSDYIPRLKDGIKPNKDFLQNGDIVFADTAEDEMVGKAVEVRGLGDGKAVSGLHTMACRPRADMFAPRFLGYYLNSDSYRKQLLPLITGSKVSSLSQANFESTTLTMPDITEQQAIADLLSEQDAAIAALEAKREKYARIKEGMMRDLLTGKVRI